MTNYHNKNNMQQLDQIQNENLLVENLRNNLNFIREKGIAPTKESIDLDRSVAIAAAAATATLH